MLYEKTVTFQFKGKRNYVHGTDIYDAALEIIKEHFGLYPLKFTGSFHLLLANDGLFRIYEADHDLKDTNPHALFLFTINDSNYKILLLPAPRKVTDSYEYDENRVLHKAQLSTNRIHKTFSSAYTYMEQIVAMTKKLHLIIYPETSWLFTRIQLSNFLDPIMYFHKTLTVEFEKNFYNKLTQSSIALDNEPGGSIYFTARLRKEIS